MTRSVEPPAEARLEIVESRLDAVIVENRTLVHEFNNVFAGLSGYVRLIREDIKNAADPPGPDADLALYLEQMDHLIVRALGLVGRLRTSEEEVVVLDDDTEKDAGETR